MSKKKKRTISYQKANWVKAPRMTLQQALELCLDAMPHAPDTRFHLRDGLAEVRHRDRKKRSVRLHIAAWTAGESASIVPHVAANIVDADLDEQLPTKGSDFLDGDGMVMVSDNHCLLMPSGMHPKAIELYVSLLLEQGRDQFGAGLPDYIEEFELSKVANPAMVQTVREEGIKKLHLNVSQRLETEVKAREAVERTTIRQQLKQSILDGLLMRDEDRRKIKEAENVQVRLTITCDTRKAGITPEDLTPIAAGVAGESEDGIEVETGEGTRIKHGELILTKTVAIAPFAKTVHHNHAWEEMEQYFRELHAQGMLRVA